MSVLTGCSYRCHRLINYANIHRLLISVFTVDVFIYPMSVKRIGCLCQCTQLVFVMYAILHRLVGYFSLRLID